MIETRRSLPIAILSAFALLAACASAQERPAPRPRGPGYHGTWPSELGKRQVAQLEGETFEDRGGRIGGGTWRIERGGVTPHPLGPGAAGALELRSARTKGPHVRLVQGKLAFFLPTRTDGDVAELLALLGRVPPGELAKVRTSDEWREATRRIDGLGAARHGVRLAVFPDAEVGHARVLVWNVGDEAVDLKGTAALEVGEEALPVTLPVPLHWPPRVERPADRSRVVLGPGSTYELQVAVPEADERPREVRFVFRPDPPQQEPDEAAPPPAASATVRVGSRRAATKDGG